MKNNVDKAKKALFKLNVLIGRMDLDKDTKLQLFNVMIKLILLYSCEAWGHENIEQIEVFYRNFLRRLLPLQKSVPKAMTFGELGKQELKLTIWQNWYLSYVKNVSSIRCSG